MKIKYVGRKDFKTDNVAGTGLTWGSGDSLEVADPAKAARLLRHPDVWTLDEEVAKDINLPSVVPVTQAKTEADRLRDALGALGINVPKNRSLDKLRELAISKGIDPDTLKGDAPEEETNEEVA